MTPGDTAAIAFLLDLWWGDPRWLPHPVSAIARVAQFLERMTRRFLPAKLAGSITAVLVLTFAGLSTWALIRVGTAIHPYLGTALQILVLYTCFATKSLIQHAAAVWTPLKTGDLEKARQKVGWMVGRDTQNLSEEGITRATVESVGENTVDGLTAPLLFALTGGPVAAVIFKAASTLDSLFGYRNSRYLAFGWASARLDDLFNWLPARLTAPAMLAIGLLPGLRLRHGIRIYLRDRKKHPSPNAAHGEAVMAGLLGVQLGGPSSYGGMLSHKQRLGDPLEALHPNHIRRANLIAGGAAALIAALGWALWFFISKTAA